MDSTSAPIPIVITALATGSAPSSSTSLAAQIALCAAEALDRGSIVVLLAGYRALRLATLDAAELAAIRTLSGWNPSAKHRDSSRDAEEHQWNWSGIVHSGARDHHIHPESPPAVPPWHTDVFRTLMLTKRLRGATVSSTASSHHSPTGTNAESLLTLNDEPFLWRHH